MHHPPKTGDDVSEAASRDFGVRDVTILSGQDGNFSGLGASGEKCSAGKRRCYSFSTNELKDKIRHYHGKPILCWMMLGLYWIQIYRHSTTFY